MRTHSKGLFRELLHICMTCSGYLDMGSTKMSPLLAV